MPRGGGQKAMGLREGAGAWWVGGVGGVEVGVKGERVVGVAAQGSHAVVVGAAEDLADGVGEQRVWADLEERAVVGTGRGDGLAEPHRVA